MTYPLIFDGQPYISAAEASKRTGLSRDYLARLARVGRVRGRVIAHMWFIEMHSLQQFLVTRTSARTILAGPV